ncbi:MAG: class I SAM-dependent methyltransferase [Rhodospirillales bacterium]|nr:class I SAM-dependent methyltransferase [Rhodospirillales bacterium]MCB9997081.1 class I SAM-dependent methyltransferase [Rhodospirillales bacterium]
MDDALKTLLLPFETGGLRWPDQDGAVQVYNGVSCAHFPEGAFIEQYFKPLAAGTVQQMPKGPAVMALVLGSKQHQETLYLMGRALAALQEDGVLVCAAANDAGGRRLKKDLQTLGLEVFAESKHKCQVVWTRPGGIKAPEWIAMGALQPVLDGAFVSQPGIFGWDRIDAGSALLADYLTAETLQGAGADFGCGYGFLSDHIVRHCHEISALYCIDADYRAVQACRKNLEGRTQCHFIWSDLTAAQADLPALDWVVMNPPFHEGKAADPVIGKAFIKSAAAALKRGGSLWMVANTHLPYEEMLHQNFAQVRPVMTARGFKVIHAQK